MPHAQLQLLIKLAKVDGILSKDEIALITKIAHHKGLSQTEVNTLFAQDENTPPLHLSKIGPEERFEYLYTIVELVKIDGRLYEEEMHFCREAAHMLGYDDGVLYHFLMRVPVTGGKKEKIAFKKYISKSILANETSKP